MIVESRLEFGATVRTETGFFITSLLLLTDLIGPMERSHSAVENRLTGAIDMVCRDDEYRVRTDHAPADFITIKHLADNLPRRAAVTHS